MKELNIIVNLQKVTSASISWRKGQAKGEETAPLSAIAVVTTTQTNPPNLQATLDLYFSRPHANGDYQLISLISRKQRLREAEVEAASVTVRKMYKSFNMTITSPIEASSVEYYPKRKDFNVATTVCFSVQEKDKHCQSMYYDPKNGHVSMYGNYSPCVTVSRSTDQTDLEVRVKEQIEGVLQNTFAAQNAEVEPLENLFSCTRYDFGLDTAVMHFPRISFIVRKSDGKRDSCGAGELNLDYRHVKVPASFKVNCYPMRVLASQA